MFMIVWFLRSATPFCWGVKAVVSCLLIPCALQNFLNVIELYSPPLSVLRHLMNNPICYSTNALNALNWWNTSDSSSTKYIHVFLEKSSIKLIKYLIWLFDGGLIRPQRSEWISCNLSVSLHLLYYGNGTRWCFPLTHASQVVFTSSISGKPTTISLLYNVWSPL